MKNTTRQRIIDTAVQLFNESGFGNTSLQDLSKKLSMSRGNLAYHFADKHAILKEIGEQFTEKVIKGQAQRNRIPSFENLHHEVKLYFAMQQQYAFIFMDPLLLSNPVLKSTFREFTKQTIQDNEASIALAIQVGNMYPEPFPGLYKNLAINVWMLMFFWYPRQVLLGKKTKESAEKAVWSMMLPHFTEKGINAFKHFYGEDFLKNLGEPYDLNMENLMTF